MARLRAPKGDAERCPVFQRAFRAGPLEGFVRGVPFWGKQPEDGLGLGLGLHLGQGGLPQAGPLGRRCLRKETGDQVEQALGRKQLDETLAGGRLERREGSGLQAGQ
ncbi:MAG: hypothetical protein IPI84_08810 [Holophagaceae bacterium]|nr:hypothetical protein [Holophagaceae bacterium]